MSITQWALPIEYYSKKISNRPAQDSRLQVSEFLSFYKFLSSTHEVNGINFKSWIVTHRICMRHFLRWRKVIKRWSKVISSSMTFWVHSFSRFFRGFSEVLPRCFGGSTEVISRFYRGYFEVLSKFRCVTGPLWTFMNVIVWRLKRIEDALNCIPKHFHLSAN